jgi:hypothetical protein
MSKSIGVATLAAIVGVAAATTVATTPTVTPGHYEWPVMLSAPAQPDSSIVNVYTPVKGVVGQHFQLCEVATDTSHINGAKGYRRVLLNGRAPQCAIMFRMWDSLETVRFGGHWP